MKRLQTDVLVVGGGTAGVVAAVSAARNGADVILAERDGALGGVGARAGVHMYYYGTKAGVQPEIDDEMGALGTRFGGKSLGYHPEAKRFQSSAMLRDAGVRIFYHALAAQVDVKNGEVRGVQFETPTGALKIDAAVTIDATGDGDVCAMAGAPYSYGRDWDGIANNYSLVARYVYKDNIRPLNVDAGWVESRDPRDISRAYIEGRQVLFDLLGSLMTHDTFIASSPHLGVREGRSILGEYVLQMDDLVSDRRFPDVVMRCTTHHDTHAYDLANESLMSQLWTCVMGLWRQKIGGDIPYRCFVPREVDGLLIGSRALSQHHDAAVGFRMQRDMQQVGEVAGTAAALCVGTNAKPRELNVQLLQKKLIAQGILSRDDLTRDSRPWVASDVHGDHDRVEALCDALATDDGGKALWNLWKMGPAVVPFLAERLQDAGSDDAFGLSIALALHGSEKGVSRLIEAVRNKEESLGTHQRAVPRWIASLIVLKAMGHPAALAFVADAVKRERDTTHILHMLHYAIAVIGQENSGAVRSTLHQSITALYARPDRGEEYVVWGKTKRSMKWSIDLAIACLLTLLGDDEGQRIFDRYESDFRSYVQNAAHRVRKHTKTMLQTKAEVS